MRGRTRLFSWAFAIAVTTSSIDIAAAQTTLQSIKVGGWSGGAYARDGRRFTHCAATMDYDSGVRMLFSIDRNYRWSMGLAKRDWQLRHGGV
jgi:hypothetical protein